MNTVKKYLLPIVIVVLIVLAIVLNNVFSNKKESEKTPINFNENTALDVFGKEDSYVKHLCYLYEKPANAELGSIDYNREYVDLKIVDGNTVSGSHAIIPAGQDSNYASFIGATNGEYINVIASAEAEGEKWQEQRVYKRGEQRLYVGYQETPEPQVQNENGVFMYQGDIKNLKFETDEFYLDLIDCEELQIKLNQETTTETPEVE